MELADLVEVIQGDAETDVAQWVAANRSRLEALLRSRGGVMLRGFAAANPTVAQQALAALGAELLSDAYWSTPRTSVAGKTFTATEYTSSRPISLHSEMSYMTSWPRLIAFHALVVAQEGGQTTISSIDAASKMLEDILEPFHKWGIVYQRTHHSGIDVPWRKAYQTDDRAEVERIASAADMQTAWLGGDVLQTRHRAQGCVTAEDGRLLFFNQSNLFHPASLPPNAERQLSQLLGADRLPRNAFFGDGSPIPATYIQRANEAFNTHAFGVPWQAGDVLLLDNMRYAHGRAPFKGQRKVHVAMAAQHSAPCRTPIFDAASNA